MVLVATARLAAGRVVPIVALSLSLFSASGWMQPPKPLLSCRSGAKTLRQGWCNIADRTVRGKQPGQSADVFVRNSVFRRIRVRWAYRCNPSPALTAKGVGLVGYRGRNGVGKELFQHERFGRPGRDGSGKFTFNVAGARSVALSAGINTLVPHACVIHIHVDGRR